MPRSAVSRRARVTGLDLLKDSRLLREFAYIDGAWTTSSSGRQIGVTDPASGEWIGNVPALERGGEQSSHRRRAARLSRLGRAPAAGARAVAARLVRPDHRPP